VNARDAAYAALAATRPRVGVPPDTVEHLLTLLRAQGAQCTRVRDGVAARTHIAHLLRGSDTPALIAGDAWLEELLSGDDSPRRAPEAPGNMTGFAITTAVAAVAETGSLLLHPRPGAPMAMNFLCDRLVVLLKAEDVVPNLEDLWARVRQRFGEATPRALCLVSGPSTSGDIGMQFATGVHGPIELHAIVLDA